MKSRMLTSFIAITLFTVLAIPFHLAAQEQEEKKDQKAKHHHYKLIDMGAFGGPQSYISTGTIGGGGPTQVLSDRGILVGAADTSMSDPFSPICFNNEAVGFGIGDCFVSHAFEWRDGHQSDLGVLPGGGSSMALWVGDAGLVVGVSQNGETDPVVPGFPENRGVVWKDGQITDLGTLGGNESYAVTGNNRGQVVGYSVNTTPDPFSFIDFIFLNASNGTQTRAVLWQDGVVQDLGTLGGPDSGANYVNEHGQVAGVSYTNSTPNPVAGELLFCFGVTM